MPRIIYTETTAGERAANKVHLVADFQHFTAVIGIDQTNIENPIFVRFGRLDKVNFPSVVEAKAWIETQLLHYVTKLQSL